MRNLIWIFFSFLCLPLHVQIAERATYSNDRIMDIKVKIKRVYDKIFLFLTEILNLRSQLTKLTYFVNYENSVNSVKKRPDFFENYVLFRKNILK
jgi:hypothetical protein